MTVGALLEEAFAHHEAGRLEQAETLYRNLLVQDEDNLNALQLLGAIAIDRRRDGEAVAWLGRAAGVLQTHGNATAQHAALFHNLGNALAAVGRGAETVATYQRGLALDPDLPELSARLATALAQQGDLAGAATHYETALRLRPDHADWLLNLGNIKVALEQPEAALELYRQALAHEPGNAGVLRAAGLTLLSLQRPTEAVEQLVQLVASRPDDPSAHYLIGRAYLEAQQWEEAAVHFDRALALRPDDAETYWMMGCLAEARHDFDAAETTFRRAVDLAPELPTALFDLGTLLYREREQPAEAIALFERLLAVVPDHVGVHCALGNAFRVQGRADLALASYQRYAALSPNSALAHLRLGQAFIDVGQTEQGFTQVGRSLELGGGHNLTYLAHVVLGNALVKLQRGAEAQAHFRAALQLEPLATNHAAKAEADFAALLVLAPGSYNTPYEYLVDRTEFDSHVLLLLPDHEYDAAFLASHADVVVNLVSDIDQDNAMLPVAAALIDRLGKPVINHPDRIRSTDRVTIASLLSGIPSCRVAWVERHAGTALLAPAFWARYAERVPFLARLAGRHGGDDFERIDSVDDLQRLVLQNPESDYFLIEYIDYRSTDGFYRKYRFFALGDAILPYHLAISSGWKVHHFSTDMANQPWMRREEERFVRDPEAVFEPRHYAALRAIRDAMGLDFFGIDCSLDRAGNLVVFEANATMLIHADTGDFAYKTPYVRRIKAAFGEMLARVASGRSRPRP
ncbi:MAG: tetratricopeptide repeat protein [Acetobacteraceae bacterium]|nr:tetratricopeptide repeat protein [Acetobacteraceae bacterium]